MEWPQPLSSSAHAGDPVRRGFAVYHWRLGILDRPHTRAMTAGGWFTNAFSFPQRDAPEVCMKSPPDRGRGECRVPVAPAARVHW
jgi:hypothetical protein